MRGTSLSTSIKTVFQPFLVLCALSFCSTSAHAGRLTDFCRNALQVIAHPMRALEDGFVRNAQESMRRSPLPRRDHAHQFTDEEAAAIKSAVTWAKASELTIVPAIRTALLNKKEHALPLILAARYPEQAKSLLGPTNYALNYTPRPSHWTFRSPLEMALDVDAPAEVINELLRKGELLNSALLARIADQPQWLSSASSANTLSKTSFYQNQHRVQLMVRAGFLPALNELSDLLRTNDPKRQKTGMSIVKEVVRRYDEEVPNAGLESFLNAQRNDRRLRDLFVRDGMAQKYDDFRKAILSDAAIYNDVELFWTLQHLGVDIFSGELGSEHTILRALLSNNLETAEALLARKPPGLSRPDFWQDLNSDYQNISGMYSSWDRGISGYLTAKVYEEKVRNTANGTAPEEQEWVSITDPEAKLPPGVYLFDTRPSPKTDP